jgi:4-diphosphocytidyl-2-C-methyl-D-erythritol kinase
LVAKEGTAQILHTRQKTTCLPSPAKLNLGLRVVGRRADGYHLIESLFWPLAFGDELWVKGEGPLKVEAAWEPDAPRKLPPAPQGEENLVFRAVERTLGPQAPLSIEIRKRIPLGAGLGGGSSNAGVLIKYLVDTGKVAPQEGERAALSLGADVPFFLGCRPTWVSGIGENRHALEVHADVRESLSFLLIVPPKETPTPVVFAKFRQLGVPFAPSRPLPPGRPLNWKGLERHLSEAENSLQGVAAMEYPLLADILSRLAKLPTLYSGLSGTGSTCFAVFRDLATAQECAQDLQSFCRKSDCKSITTRTFVGT